MKNFFINDIKMHRLILVFLVIVTILSGESFAQRWVNYSIPHGLAGETVKDILVDQKGDLWFATYNGISRFNGNWLSCRNDDGLINNRVCSIIQDSDGKIWFGTDEGISKIDPSSDLNDPGNWQSYTTANTDSGLSNDHIKSILIDKEGKMWFGTNDGGISVVDPTPDSIDPFQDPLLDPNNWVTFTTKDGLGSNVIRTMEMDEFGNIWVSTDGDTSIYIYELENRRWINFNLQFATEKAETIFKDCKGNIWIGTKYGIYKAFPKNLSTYDEHYSKENGMANNDVLTIAQDREGAIWFGHGYNGVSMALPDCNLKDSTNWQNFTMIEGLAWRQISSIVEDQEENVWFGHPEKKGVSQLDRSWLSFLTQRETKANFINGLFTDNQRTLWIATEEGAVRIDLDANLLLEKNVSDTLTMWNSGLRENNIRIIFQDSQSFLWFGTDRGAYRVAVEAIGDSSKWSFYNPNPYPIIFNWILEDILGYIWFAREKGVNRVHIDSINIDNSWMTITKSDGLAADEINVILSDKNGNLWFGTNNGLSFFNPTLNPKISENWLNYNTSNEPIKAKSICRFIYEDIKGNIWFATDGGVIKIDPTTDLGDSSNWESYTTEKGLASNFVTSITQLKENEIWFGTAIGASKFEMNNPINKWSTYTKSTGLKSNFITSLFADRAKNDIWFGTSGGGVTRYRWKPKPPETFLDTRYDIVTENLVTFEFHGKDIITPEEDIRYQYKLDKIENLNWDETSDRFATVFVEDSEKPERHIFQVRSIDGDGNVDPSPATDTFWKLNQQMGGWISKQLEYGTVELYIPPTVLQEREISITDVKPYELQDSLAILAFDITSQSEDSLNLLSKPATLRVKMTILNGLNKNEVAIFQRDGESNWIRIGGTVESTSDSTISITTTFIEFGIYAVRKINIIESERSDKINIQPRIFSPTGDGQGHGDRATISFMLHNNSLVTVKIYNIAGRLKRILTDNLQFSLGINAVEWNGRDDNGTVCPTGLYIVAIEVEGKVYKKTIIISNKY